MPYISRPHDDALLATIQHFYLAIFVPAISHALANYSAAFATDIRIYIVTTHFNRHHLMKLY